MSTRTESYLLEFIQYEPGTSMRPQREKAESALAALIAQRDRYEAALLGLRIAAQRVLYIHDRQNDFAARLSESDVYAAIKALREALADDGR